MKRILSLIAAHRLSLWLLLAAITMAPLPSQAESPAILPNTAQIEWEEEDLSERLMDGAHEFVERKIAEAHANRADIWEPDLSSPEAHQKSMAAYDKSIAPHRERFRKMIGATDERISPVTMEKFGEGNRPGLVAENEWFRIWQVRWPVLKGVWSEGLLVEPTTETPDVVGGDGEITPDGTALLTRLRKDGSNKFLIAIPDADTSPEKFLGIGEKQPHQGVSGLAKAGFTIVIPTLINRQPYLGESGDDPRLTRAKISHREWIYRQSFHLGRHPIGFEAQKVCAAVDWIMKNSPNAKIGCYGFGEGGLIAWFAAAIDTRISAIAMNGILGEAESSALWKQPISRNIFGFDSGFGWEGAIDLLHYRKVWFMSESGPSIQTSKGNLTSLANQFDQSTIDALAIHSGNKGWGFAQGSNFLVAHDAYEFFTETSLPDIAKRLVYLFFDQPLSDSRPDFSPEPRHNRLFKQLEDHVQQLIRNADDKREEQFLYQAEPLLRPGKWSTNKRHPTLDPAAFIEKAKAFRKTFSEEAMGEFNEPLLPINPRTRLITETDEWAAWDVVLDVYPELFAWGALVLPKDLKPGEKRPVVVCQHGRNGLPRDSIDADKTAYNDFAAKLAERGFITFAPHNLYRGEDRYRWLDRKANAVGCSLFSFIIPSHRQILNWLKTQPNVDPDRIAFYGLSYGGESAVRIPPVLEDYAVAICSGDFNQWTRKVAATEHPGTFMKTIEWEMPYWNLGNTFDYAEMAYLIFPRPFMVERGHHDGVGIDPWVAHEYAKVRRLYAQFGLADRTEIEFFQGGHSINGKGTFDFLHKHLNWPKPQP